MKHIKFGRGYINDYTVEGIVDNSNIENEVENELLTYWNRYRDMLRREVDLEYYRNNLINQHREEQ
jgi:hypothetical protein